MLRKNRGICGFLAPPWVLITKAPRDIAPVSDSINLVSVYREQVTVKNDDFSVGHAAWLGDC